VEAARRFGKRIAIHTYGPAGFRDAVRAGPDSIEHGADVDDDTLWEMAEMARKKIFWVPTIDHNRYYAEARDEYQFGLDAVKGLHDYIARNLETARRAHKIGMRFAMGSDAVFTMFGQNTRELEWFVKAGMTAEEALKTATLHGAELLGVADRLGKVQPGYLADLVAVEGRPWEDVDGDTPGPVGDEGRRSRRGPTGRRRSETGQEGVMRWAFCAVNKRLVTETDGSGTCGRSQLLAGNIDQFPYRGVATRRRHPTRTDRRTLPAQRRRCLPGD
jgi:hypothetical protein